MESVNGSNGWSHESSAQNGIMERARAHSTEHAPARRPESGVSGWSQVGARRSTTRKLEVRTLYFCICSGSKW